MVTRALCQEMLRCLSSLHGKRRIYLLIVNFHSLVIVERGLAVVGLQCAVWWLMLKR